MLASFIAFLCGSFLNAFVMSKMKVLQKGKGFSLRAIASTIAGEGADSIIFFSIAFAGQISLHDILNLVMTQTIMKTTYEIIMLPITGKAVRWVKKKDDTDTFDNNISYNPFSH